MTRVSIVVPCFNGGAMVSGAVASAVAQTYTDLEIVVVNDGSSDTVTLEALRHLENLPRVRVVHQDNRGLPHALNRGVEESNGDYILPLAHDDEFHPTYVEKAARILRDRPDVGIVYCRAERFGASHGEWHLLDFDLGRMLLGNLIFACAMYRRTDWQRVGGYSDSMRRGFEDHDFWLRILALGRQVERIDEVLFRYRDTEGSLSNTMVPGDRVDAFAQVFRSNIDLYALHAPEFAEVVVGQTELLSHFKQRYGRVEKVIARLGAWSHRIRSLAAR